MRIAPVLWAVAALLTPAFAAPTVSLDPQEIGKPPIKN